MPTKIVFDMATQRYEEVEITDSAELAAYTALRNPPVSRFDGFQEMTGSALTQTVTPTEIFRATLQPGRGYVADYQIIAVQAGSPYNMLYGRWMQGAKRVGTLSNAALVGTQQAVIPPQGDAAAAGLAIAPEVVGQDFRILVTGLASVKIRWFLRGMFVVVAPDGIQNVTNL